MVYKEQINPECITFTQANIIYNTRLFWRQLVYWTRTYYYSAFSGIGNAEETFARLYNTPSRYANMLQLVLGRPIADRYLALFNEYIIILRQIVTAVLNGDIDQINDGVSRLTRNSEERAEFLSQIFPSLDKAVLKEMLDTYASYEIEELNEYVNQDFTKIIENYDRLIQYIDCMADYFSKGIIDSITFTLEQTGNASHRKGFKNQDVSNCITYDELTTSLNIALFWVELIGWLRAYRISKMANVGNQAELYNRVIQVTVDYGDRLKTFLDDETVDTFIQLVQEYIRLIDQFLEARIVNNIDEVNRLYPLLISNMNEQAVFLASVFPSLDEARWRDQLYKMNTNLIDMGTAFLSGNYSTNIQIFDALLNQAEELGSYFTQNLFELMNE